jgi:membrane protease YdiL (CAAX protease family)
MNQPGSLKPLSWRSSLAIYLVIASVSYVTYYILVPNYTLSTHQPYLVGYLWGWGIAMGLVFTASILLYKLEGLPSDWQAFSTRYRLPPLTRQDWFWTVVVLVVTTGTYFGLSFTAEWLAAIPFFAPHQLFPPELGPKAATSFVSGRLFGMSLHRQWGVAIAYCIGWVLNILGEEFFYRGWLLPRQEAAFGRWAWLVNGSMFCFQHFMQPWNFLAIWPGALFMAYIVQRRRNTWIGIFQHGLMNFSLFVFVLMGVFG